MSIKIIFSIILNIIFIFIKRVAGVIFLDIFIKNLIKIEKYYIFIVG